MVTSFTKRDILSISLTVIIGLCSFGAWQYFTLAIDRSGVSDVWWPILWFSFLAVFFFLGAIVWKNVLLRIVGAAFVFLPGLCFLFSWEYLALGMLSTACMYWSALLIAHENEERTRFHFFKSVRAGSFVFIVGLSLVLSGGYYVSLKNASWEELVPRFRIGEEMTRGIFKIAGIVNPSFATLSEGEMTVDEFLLSLKQTEKDAEKDAARKGETEQSTLGAMPHISQFLSENNIKLLPSAQPSKIAEELFLGEGRKQIAALVGRGVSGDEKVSDVLSFALQNKLVTLLSGEKQVVHIPSQAIPFFLSLLLFLTLLSFSSITVSLSIFGAQLLFFFLLHMRWLSLRTAMVEQEKLAE